MPASCSPAHARRPGADTYRQLSLFGDVFEVREIRDRQMESSSSGDQRHAGGLDRIRATWIPELPDDAGADSRRVRSLGIEVTMEDGLIKSLAADR